MNKSILISDLVSAKGVQDLSAIEGFDIVDGSSWERAQLQEEIHRFDGLIVRSATTVDQALLDCASNLEVVLRAGTGVDNIDIAYATAKNIVVMNTPGTNAQAAAELTMGLMLMAVRNLPHAVTSIQQGKWERKQFVGSELHGKTLGIIGLGNIGQRVAKIANGFGMQVLAVDPRDELVLDDAVDVIRVDLDRLAAESDIITLHTALVDQTRGMINAAFFAKVKAGLYLINCARAELIDSKDLLSALDQGVLAGAAIDVLEQEPPQVDDPFLLHPSIVVTPHLGASTREAQDNVMSQAVQQLQQYFCEGKASFMVNA